MNNFHWAFIVLGVIGIACFVSFGLIGAHMDEQGHLREPLVLVPIGWLAMFLSGIFLLASFDSKV